MFLDIKRKKITFKRAITDTGQIFSCDYDQGSDLGSIRIRRQCISFKNSLRCSHKYHEDAYIGNNMLTERNRLKKKTEIR